MKILVISPRIPAEGKKGDQVLAFNRLKFLSRSHQILLICFYQDEDDYVYKYKLECLGIKVELLRWSKMMAVLGLVRGIFNPNKPFQCAIFESKIFKLAVSHAVLRFQPDFIYSITIRVLGNLAKSELPLVVDMIDSMSLNFNRRLNASKGLKRFLIGIEQRRVSAYENMVADKSVCSFVVSDIDRKMIGSPKVKVLPLGIDTDVFVKDTIHSNDFVICFTGNMNYKPNIEAVLWFYKNCWAKLKDILPSVKFVVAGSNPTSEIKALEADDSITITGRVRSIADILNRSNVSIAPMQSGSGMQFKILEAMSCGVPVIATTLGLGDIAAVANKSVLLADSPETFIDALVEMFKSKSHRDEIAQEALKYVHTNHSWKSICEHFEQSIISEVLGLKENES